MLRRAFLLGTVATLASAKAAQAMSGTDRVLFGRAPSWVPNPANPPDIAINWKTNQAWKRNGGLTSPASLGISTSRASVKQVVDSSGQWAQIASNVTARSDLGRSTEEARTNILLRNTALGNAAWGQTSCSVSTAGGQTAPDGSASVTSIIAAAAASNHNLFNNVALTLTNAVYTTSVFFKPAGYNFGWLSSTNFTNGFTIVVNLLTGAITQTATLGTPNATSGATVYANGWVRCWFTSTQSTSANHFFSFGPSDTGTPTISGLSPTFTGDGVSGVYAYWPQCELGSSLTSPITTAGASATRAADVTTLTGLTLGSAYTIFEQAIPQTPLAYPTNQILLSINDSSSNNRAQFSRILTNGFSSVFVSSGGVQQYNVNGAAWAQNTSGKIALAAIAGAQNAAFNGTALAAGTGATMPVSPTQINFGYSAGPALFFNGLAAVDAIWLTQAVPSAQLVTMTT